MSELIANNGMQISVTALGAWIPGDPNLVSNATLFKTLSVKTQCPNGEFVLCKDIAWTMLPLACTLASNTFVGGSSTPLPPPGLNNAEVIQATTTKVKCDTFAGVQPVLREGDRGKCNGLFTLTASPFTPTPCQCEFEITDANQTKVRAE